MSIATTLQFGDALVIVDVQEDLLPGGAVAVPGGDKVVGPLGEYAARFERQQLPIYAVRAWHPENHVEFLARGGAWPEHCVRQTEGADFAEGLELPPSAITISTGTGVEEMGDSAFGDPRFEESLRARRVRRLFVGGLGMERGVLETVRDARRQGFEVFTLRDGMRARDPAEGARAEAEMARLGAVSIAAVDLCQRNPGTGALLTDIFEVTMLRAYYEAGMTEPAVFEFAIRSLPPGRNFLVAAGLEQVLEFLEELHFTDCELDWLERARRFSPGFLESLRGLRFTGDVRAMPEGTVFFPHEPMLRITAPLAQAQLIETRVTNLLHYPTLVASKAARAVLAAEGRVLTDVGLRRAHGAEAGVLAARACYLAGFSATSDALAAQQFGIPVAGTMARSFVEAAVSEDEAFRMFAKSEPENAVLLIDTHDAEAAARRIARLAPAWRAEGVTIRGVRIEGGDLERRARGVRRILDAGGLGGVRIFASGNLDEEGIRRLVAGGAPIDGFGVGTRLVTSADAPFLDCDYKLQLYNGRRRAGRSEGEPTWPGVKQVYRMRNSAGRMECDVVALEDEPHEGEPLLREVMRGGRRTECGEALAESRERVAQEVKRLPSRLRELAAADPYPVYMSERLHALCEAAGVFPVKKRGEASVSASPQKPILSEA